MSNRLFDDSKYLFDDLCSESVLKTAFLAVRKNKGAPGVDDITIEEFQEDIDNEISQIVHELKAWQYKPSPARRVKIPKPSEGKTKKFRDLGIPCVKDRVVQHALKTLLEPFFEPIFSPYSFGFRPNKSARQAVERAQELCKEGKDICVDIDLEKFFDTVNHDRLIAKLKPIIKDTRILRLIGIILRSGIMENGLTSYSSEGTPQGSPLSPLLSNFVLHELDKELENQGLSFCRYADDCNIFVSSKKAAMKVMDKVTVFIENKLKLKINRDKSKIAKSRNVKFLGMTISNKNVAISVQSIKSAKLKVKHLISRNDGKSIEQTIKRFNSWFRGWSNYYSMSQYPIQFVTIEAHARRRLRAKIIKHSKRPKFLYRKLRKLGISYRAAAIVFKNHKCWALSKKWALHKAFNKKWFNDQGLYTCSDFNMEHWFPTHYRI